MSRRKKWSAMEIAEVYRQFDRDDVSTERLLAMVADACNCGVDDVIDALLAEGVIEEVTT